jgi:two-component system sensor kinase FixL
LKKVQKSTLVGPLDALMEAAGDAIIIIDEKGLIQRFNPAAEKMFGYSESEVRGRNVSLLMPEPNRGRHDGYLARYARTGEAAVIGKGRQETGLRSNGESFPMQLSVGEIRQADQRSFVGIIRDISEMRQAQEQVRHLEEQLLHADRLVILGELTAGIAHEINQPLTAIAAYADAGRTIIDRIDEAPAADMHSICERIGGQARRAAEVVQRLRGLVRSGTSSKGRHNLNEIIKNILLLFEFEIKKTGTELLFFPLEPLEDLYVDDIQIQQILVNLIKNSLDSIGEAAQANGCIEIRIRTEGQNVMVSVTDNGPGVPEQYRPRLFDSFFTTKPKGVGLGLSICKSIAAAHGGTLRHEQPQEGGSRFTLSLPLRFIG